MTPRDRERYSRQIVFSGIGEAGQRKLLESHAVVVGCGALGSFQAAALARAGVGRITILDRDLIEPSNLQRQWLFDEADAEAALPKAAAAERALRRINSGIEVSGIVADLTASNVEELLAGAQVILDGTDNFEARYLINDYAVREGIPWIYGGAVGSYGITMPVVPGRGACFRCMYPEPPSGVQPTCETAGVLGSITAAIAALQVADALKLLCGTTFPPLVTTLDVWNGGVRQIGQPPPDPDCRTCGRREFPGLRGEGRAPISLCGRNAVQIHERSRPLDLRRLREALASLGEVRCNEFGLRFFCSPYELTVFPDGRAIVKGTTDVGVARSLYAKYIGA
ncbi:MAG: ThiF family adenylyltransferase [Acidobacteria bacterium]|nr:ThiF family adenylyltransferase [Acidobacteriota bacterium]